MCGMLRTDDLDYELPVGSVATMPTEPRDAARLMVLSRRGMGVDELATMADLPRFLRAGDLMVFNATRVIPARLVGRKPTGGRVEGLYLAPGSGPGPREGGMRTWIVMLGASHLHVGTEVEVMSGGVTPSGVRLHLLQRDVTEPTAWVVRVEGVSEDESDPRVLERCGLTPLPPYIRKAREKQGIAVSDETDRERYQTVYAHDEEPKGGSVAAPTAGLHFTERLLERLDALGVKRAEVTLHVGTGTFKPVETEFIEQHPMHEEWCTMSAATVRQVLETKKQGGRVIAVGTTAARTLESYAGAVGGEDGVGDGVPESISTRLLITPGYGWKWVDGMVTNFHLPRSTLMAMVASRLDGEEGGGLKRLKEAYVRALAEGFRFYSYGDGMLIVP